MMTERIDIRRTAKNEYNVGVQYEFYGISMEDVELLTRVIRGAIDTLPMKLTMTSDELDAVTK